MHQLPADYRNLLRLLRQRFLPLDMSSTFSRSLFRIPSIYLLGKTTVIWAVLLLQAANLYPTASWLQALSDWVARKQMEDICRFTFTSVCIAMTVGSLTRGLEGASGNQTPFNLVRCASVFVARVLNFHDSLLSRSTYIFILLHRRTSIQPNLLLHAQESTLLLRFLYLSCRSVYNAP